MHTRYESSGSVRRKVHESPAITHSAAVAQNWSGSWGGHGGGRQLGMRACDAQQMSPAAQFAALVQATLPRAVVPAPPLLDGVDASATAIAPLLEPLLALPLEEP